MAIEALAATSMGSPGWRAPSPALRVGQRAEGVEEKAGAAGGMSTGNRHLRAALSKLSWDTSISCLVCSQDALIVQR